MQYINNVLLPYITKERSELGLSSDHRSLVIFDWFKGQCTRLKLALEDNNIGVLLMPANCTDRLSPMDISMIKSALGHQHE